MRLGSGRNAVLKVLQCACGGKLSPDSSHLIRQCLPGADWVQPGRADDFARVWEHDFPADRIRQSDGKIFMAKARLDAIGKEFFRALTWVKPLQKLTISSKIKLNPGSR